MVRLVGLSRLKRFENLLVGARCSGVVCFGVRMIGGGSESTGPVSRKKSARSAI